MLFRFFHRFLCVHFDVNCSLNRAMMKQTTLLLLLNKPYRVLSQFSNSQNESSRDTEKTTLSTFIHDKKVYPAGRLDYDSEGLLLLTDNGSLQHYISHPTHKLPKTYWVQIEGCITQEALDALSQGVELKDGLSKPAKVKRLTSAQIQSIPPRTPPIRHRQNIPTDWIALTITEGRNRQVRRMTANVGFPTLRLIRQQIGPWKLENLSSGEYQKVCYSETEIKEILPHYQQDKKDQNLMKRARSSTKRKPAKKMKSQNTSSSEKKSSHNTTTMRRNKSHRTHHRSHSQKDNQEDH